MARSFSAAFNVLIDRGTGGTKKKRKKNETIVLTPFIPSRGFISTFCVRRIRFNLWTFETRGEVLMVAANDKPLGFYVCARSAARVHGGKSPYLRRRARGTFATRGIRDSRYLRRNQTRLSERTLAYLLARAEDKRHLRVASITARCDIAPASYVGKQKYFLQSRADMGHRI